MNRTMIIAIIPLIIALFGILIPSDVTGAQAVCVHKGRQYRNGDEWIANRSFIMRCFVFQNRWETKVVACLSLTGDRIPVNGHIRDRHGIWKCVQDRSGSTKLVQQQA